MEGTCLCKAVAVKVNDDNLFGDQRRGHICHCKNCRKVAGGIFGTNLIIENEKVEFPNGKDAIKQYDVCTPRTILSAKSNISTRIQKRSAGPLSLGFSARAAECPLPFSFSPSFPFPLSSPWLGR